MKTTAHFVLMIFALLSFVSPTWARQGENAFLTEDASGTKQDQVKLQGESGDFYVTITKTFDVGQGGTLQVDRLSGDFVIKTWANDQVDIRNEMHIRSFTRGEAEEVFRRA
ncbi:MAG: hypothetical protein EHM72_03525, partial [Calditrichaeota bacterium]